MNKGKATCACLKEIRRRVAAENGIDLEIPECHFEGECSGTCPRCESEVRYLEGELQKRGKMGRVLATAGIAASLAVMTSCTLEGEPVLEPFDTAEMADSIAAQAKADGENCTLDGTEIPVQGGLEVIEIKPESAADGQSGSETK